MVTPAELANDAATKYEAALSALYEAEQRLDSALQVCTIASDDDTGLSAAVVKRNSLRHTLAACRRKEVRDKVSETIRYLDRRIDELKAKGCFCEAEPSFRLADFAWCCRPHVNGWWGIDDPCQTAQVANLVLHPLGQRLVEFVRKHLDGGKLANDAGQDVIVLPSRDPREMEMSPGVWTTTGNRQPVVSGADVLALNEAAIAYDAEREQKRQAEREAAQAAAEEAKRRDREAKAEWLREALSDPETAGEIRELLGSK